MTFAPNSRFMNELEVICPTNPAAVSAVPRIASWKNSSMNGTDSAYLPLQVEYDRPVGLVEGLVLDHDVGRVAHDDVVPAGLRMPGCSWMSSLR